MFGIEKMKVVLMFIINLGERFEKITREDSPGGKKVTWGEVLGSALLLKDVPSLIKAIPELKAEFLDLDETEKQELKDYVKVELDLEDDAVEKMIEKAWNTLVSLSSLIGMFGGK